jgi:hypothetical protein
MPSRKSRVKTKVKTKVCCVSCKRPIEGKPRVMRLQITHKNPSMIECARKVGFASSNWDVGKAMEGPFHKQCFSQAIRIWEIAFHTRPLSPRRPV